MDNGLKNFRYTHTSASASVDYVFALATYQLNNLILNLFFSPAPLHDGAVIINEGRIQAAGCFLPLSMNTEIMKELGTRHRAAIGASENSDAIVIVVSEETGNISVAEGGVLTRDYTADSLREYLEGMFVEPGTKRGRFKRLKKKEETGETEEALKLVPREYHGVLLLSLNIRK